jgi:hypothetical protein
MTFENSKDLVMNSIQKVDQTPEETRRIKRYYDASSLKGQLWVYVVIAVITFMATIAVLLVTLGIWGFGTASLVTILVTSVIAKKSLVWLNSDMIFVAEIPGLKGKLYPKRLSIPEVTGEKPGTKWMTADEVPLDAGFVSYKGTLALIPLWGMEYARIPARVRVESVSDTFAMVPEPSVITPDSELKASREVKIEGTFRWTPIAEMGGSFAGRVGPNCEFEGKLVELLKAQAIDSVRKVVRDRGLTSQTINSAQADIETAFANAFGNPNAPAGSDPQLVLTEIEIEYGVTVGDCKITNIVVVGVDKDSDVLRSTSETNALKEAAVQRRNVGYAQLMTMLDGLPPADRAMVIAEFVRNNGENPPAVIGR